MPTTAANHAHAISLIARLQQGGTGLGLGLGGGPMLPKGFVASVRCFSLGSLV